MPEEAIFLYSAKLKIEGLFGNIPNDRAVVVSHPHPLYGGNMYNHVVEVIIQAYFEKEYSTLRFNFRGVGSSEGAYDNGVGEQDDVRAALRYLFKLGRQHIDLVGYSFGSWVNALGLERFDHASRMIMVSPPVDFVDFSFLKYNSKIQLVIAGSQDEIAGLERIRELLPTWNPQASLRVIEGADHFYSGKTGRLKSIIQEFLDDERLKRTK